MDFYKLVGPPPFLKNFLAALGSFWAIVHVNKVGGNTTDVNLVVRVSARNHDGEPPLVVCIIDTRLVPDGNNPKQKAGTDRDRFR